MDTIFVKHVKERSPASQAGLRRGDRVVAVNGIPTKEKSYAQVVQLIVNSPEYLHLLVVPKEEDVLQRLFADTAHNPASNQQTHPELPIDRATAQQIIAQRISQRAPEFQVDALSWRSLQQPYFYTGDHERDRGQQQRSAEDILERRYNPHEIYAEIRPNEVNYRQKSRAVPQVPLYRKMGRRASEGSALSDDYGAVNSDSNMKAAYKPNYLASDASSQSQDSMPSLNYPNSAGCRLSLDVGRRESTSSLSSSIADGSKDSLASYGSNSTLTGHETDDSVIMSRYKKSFQQKEEFLRTPINSVEQAKMQREFYSRPKKLERAVWPPNETASSGRPTKPTHQNLLRVKNDIENERDLTTQNGSNYGAPSSGGVANVVPPQRMAKSPKNRAQVEGMMHEATVAPDFDSEAEDERRMYPSLQLVQKRAKEFESGRPLPEGNPLLSNRTDFSRSELARLSEKRLVPNVSERAQEYETKAVPRENSATSMTSTSSANTTGSSALKRIQRDSRSLDSSDTSEAEPRPQFRARSNSAESWSGATQDGKRAGRQDTNRSRSKDQPTNASAATPPYTDLPPLIPESVEHMQLAPSPTVTPPVIIPPTVSITPAPPTRPNQLNLEGPVRPSRHLKPPTTIVESPTGRSLSPIFIAAEDKPVVVKRRTKNTNIAEDERAMRRESYLRATEGGRMHIDSDFSDGGDISPQVLRSAHRRWRPPLFPGDIQQLRKLFEDAASSLGGSASGNSSSSASLDCEKPSCSPTPFDKDRTVVIREGAAHCKILEIDGKRAADRSWKQIWVVLKGPRLFLYKDRHHQSPIGTSDALDHSLASGVDMRTSVVRVAEDYTKRKNVLRVSAAAPCRTELLLQADGADEFADWVRTLQEQVAASTDQELDPMCSKQQAVPQLVPATTTIQVQGSHLFPQLCKGKSSSVRNRSPTGQSPVNKTRKPSQINERKSSQVGEPTTSPKSKTWRGRMAKQFRKFNQGASSPSSPTAPEGSTFGIPLEDCIPSPNNNCVPKFVEICTDIIDDRGLQTVGIYRISGNNASITALSEEVNRNYDDVPLEDQRWNDLHVVSSLLKSFFRKMPDSLVTVALYPQFIKADKIEDPKLRMEELRRLVRSLPKHNYHTLKHVIRHLKRVADNSSVNRMEAKNLAIVFGPTIVRPEGEDMESLVNNMTNQCKIVESLLINADWFFPEDDADDMPVVPLAVPDIDDFETNNQMLLENISKYEALKEQKEKNGALFSSIISAAQRKVKRKPTKGASSSQESRDEPTTPTSPKGFSQQFLSTDLKDNANAVERRTNSIPTTVMEIEKKKPTEKVPWFNYSTDKEEFYKRIENFKQETEAMLQRPRKMEISVTGIETRTGGQLSSSTSNVNQNSRLSLKPTDLHLLTKTHSASNVFARMSSNVDNARNSLDNNFSVQYNTVSDKNSASVTFRGSTKQFSRNNGRDASGGCKSSVQSGNNYGGYSEVDGGKGLRYTVRRGSSVENINSSSLDVNSNGNLKKVKYESENDSQRTGSLDSLNKISTDDESLLSTMTKLIDQKLKEKQPETTNILSGEDIPYVDESPVKHHNETRFQDKENIPRTSDLYKNPSLHKSNNTKPYKKQDVPFKESKNDKEKEEDTRASENVPDNDRLIPSGKLTLLTGSKLKRSESLNKPNDKLKRSDSLSKTEKTESNIKRREIVNSARRGRDATAKNKRKNGMPDRSIKRRHTVGGTKDPDKVTWLLDNKNHEENSTETENKDKNLRTSSPDLSSTRRERFFFEVNFIGPENMLVVRQHLIGGRPQSFPESAVFKVPLESHV